jgi:hypothetical protein
MDATDAGRFRVGSANQGAHCALTGESAHLMFRMGFGFVRKWRLPGLAGRHGKQSVARADRPALSPAG